MDGYGAGDGEEELQSLRFNKELFILLSFWQMDQGKVTF